LGAWESPKGLWGTREIALRALKPRHTEQSADAGEHGMVNSKTSGNIRISRRARHAVGNTTATGVFLGESQVLIA